jgi:hypothetical protein
MPLNPWAIVAIWLHLEVLQKNSTNDSLKKILMPSSYDIRIRQNWYCHKQKHGSFNETQVFHINFFSSYKVLKQQMTNFWVSIFVGIKSTCISRSINK